MSQRLTITSFNAIQVLITLCDFVMSQRLVMVVQNAIHFFPDPNAILKPSRPITTTQRSREYRRSLVYANWY